MKEKKNGIEYLLCQIYLDTMYCGQELMVRNAHQESPIFTTTVPGIGQAGIHSRFAFTKSNLPTPPWSKIVKPVSFRILNLAKSS